MATSNAMSTSNDNIKYKITVVENSQSISANTSNVTVSVKVYRTNTGYTTYGTGTVYLKINGTTYSEALTSDDKITSSGITVIKKTLNISHNSDGSKTLNTSARFNHQQFTSTEQSFNVALTTIPRATTPTVNVTSADMGTSITVSMPRASSSFTHTLKYSFGNASGTIGSGLGTSKAWTIPLTLANQIPKSTSGYLYITCDTYSGSTKIGTKTVKITAKVPSTVKPSISSISVTELRSGISEKFGAFVQGQSSLGVTVNASGASGSKITKYSTKFLGVTYSTKSFNVTNLPSSGSLSFSATVTDSRGRKATLTKSITVVVYSLPIVSKFKVNRANSDGSFNPDGEYAKIEYAFNISSVNSKNDKSFIIKYRKTGETNYTDLTNGSVYTANTNIVPATTFDINSTYDIQFQVKDYFKTITYNAQLSTAFTLMDFHSSGKGMAIGKVAEIEGILDIGIPVRFAGDWTDLTLDSAFKNYSDNIANRPRYKAVGNIVTIKGAVSPKIAYDSSTDPITFASGLPADLRPKDANIQFVCQGSMLNTWNLSVTTGGALTVSRYGTTDYGSISPTTWLTFCITYIV